MNLDQSLYDWIKVASESRERYGFPVGLIEERVYELKHFLGESYLSRIFASHEPMHALGLRGQELDRWLRGGAYVDQHVIGVIEFASYLRHFKDDPCLESKTLKLKKDSFPSTLFELAMAFRMRQALGTKGDVRLSCEAQDALGDFIVELNANRIICECSRLQFGEGEEEQFRLLGDLYLYIDRKTKKLNVPICLKIRINKPLTGLCFSATTQTLRQMFTQFKRDKSSKAFEDESLSASIEPLTEDSERIPFRYKDERVVDVFGTDWVSAESLCYVPTLNGKEVMEKYAKGEELVKDEYARVFVKFPRNTSDFDPYARIGNKIKRKISQTDVPEGFLGRIIFLESPWDITLMDHSRLKPVFEEWLRNSAKTITVALCQCRANPHYRNWYLYFGLPLGTAFTNNEEIRACIDHLVTYDRDFDPILNQRYSRTWEEARSIAERHRREWQQFQERREEEL